MHTVLMEPRLHMPFPAADNPWAVMEAVAIVDSGRSYIVCHSQIKAAAA